MKIKRLLAIAVAIATLTPAFATAGTIPFNPATDCALLQQPKTVLLVHATWCHWCTVFEPIYTALATNENNKAWTFYELTDDEGADVCGKSIDYFPEVFVNNMQELPDANSDDVLQHYIDKTSNENVANKKACFIYTRIALVVTDIS